ncbi:MAG: hypothetical protein K1X81_06150 [Bacteroidia bacterium]|nr:hypothetical protein [Bacteroidia bacterium]
MKKQLLLALILVAGLAVVLAFKNENTPKKYLTLTFDPNHFITVVDELGVTHTMELKGNSVTNSTTWIERAQIPLTSKLNELASKGYKLVSSSRNYGGGNYSGNFTTYIFEKE